MAKIKAARGARKKELRAIISAKLENSLKDFAPVIGEKQYKKRIRKASKILTTKLKVSKGSNWEELKVIPSEYKIEDTATAM